MSFTASTINTQRLFLCLTLFLSVVSVRKLGFSAVDQKASPGLCTDCVTQPDPLGRPLNSTRSPSADQMPELLLNFELNFGEK